MANRPRHTGFGSTYSPVNKLMVVEAYMKVNKKLSFKPIIQNGQWAVKKLDVQLDDAVDLRVNVAGQGFGYLYASFGEEETQILDIKKVTQGTHQLTFTVPQVVLSNFRLGISSTIPQGYNIDLLPYDTQYKIRTNSLMMNQHTPMHETSGLGFAGFGAFSDRDINDRAKGGADTNGNPYWDGNFDNFDWNTYGFSGIPTKTGVFAPMEFGSIGGYYAHRASTMIAKFNSNDEFLGWDTNEGRGSSGSNPAIQAGVPVCMVIQFFRKPMVATKALEWAMKDSVKARRNKKVQWKYASAMTVPNTAIMFAHENFQLNNVMHKGKPSPPTPIYQDPGVLNTRAHLALPGYYFGPNGFHEHEKYAAKLEWYNPTSGTWSKPQAFPDHIPQTSPKGFTKVIYRVPRQLNPYTDMDIINQIQSAGVSYSYSETKKIIPTYIKELNPEGKYGPIQFGARDYTPAHVLLGRPNKTDTLFQEPKDTGDWFLAPSYTTKLKCYLHYPSHIAAGVAHSYLIKQHEEGKISSVDIGLDSPNLGRVYVPGAGIKVADFEKFARMNYPEMITAFFPPNGFVPGGKLFVIARGFSTRTVAGISIRPNEDPISYDKLSGEAGSRPKARINLENNNNVQIILSTDLDDGLTAVGETELQQHWTNQFGEPLTPAFFANYNNNHTTPTGTPRRKRMTMQSPDNPLMYRVTDPGSGLYVDAPYQIMVITLDTGYAGPVAHYETVTELSEPAEDGTQTKTTKLKVTKPEDVPYARVKGEPVYLNTRTPFAYTYSQEIDIVDEVEQQVEIINTTGELIDVISGNDLDNDPVDTTSIINTQAIVDEWLRNQQQQKEGNKRTRQRSPDIYVRPRDVINPNPKFYREGSTSIAGLKGFSNSRDFYVEDVTSKWTAATSQSSLNGYSGMGNVLTDAAGNVLDFGESIWKPFAENVTEVATDGMVFAGKVVKTGTYVAMASILTPVVIWGLTSSYKSIKGASRTTAARRRARRRYNRRR